MPYYENAQGVYFEDPYTHTTRWATASEAQACRDQVSVHYDPATGQEYHYDANQQRHTRDTEWETDREREARERREEQEEDEAERQREDARRARREAEREADRQRRAERERHTSHGGRSRRHSLGTREPTGSVFEVQGRRDVQRSAI